MTGDKKMGGENANSSHRRSESNIENNIGRSYSSTSGPKQYENIREYAKDLSFWLDHYRAWCMASNFHVALTCMHSTQQSPVYSMNNNIYTRGGSNGSHVSGQYNQQRNTTHNTEAAGLPGTDYEIPPLWKRICAEAIDFIVLFYMKIIVAIAVMRQMGYLNDQNNNLFGLHVDLTPIFELSDGDIDKIFSITSEVIALEIVNRIFITFFEALCLRQGFGSPGGATPGKRMMGLKVVSCDQIIDLRNGKIRVIPAQNAGFFSALVRSMIKNFTLAFLFPACLTVFFFHHNRAAYDVIAKTIVVEAPHRRHQHA